MENLEVAKLWIDDAKCNLLRGKRSTYIDSFQIPNNLLCFDLQQCAEKSIKAIFIYYNVEFPFIHEIDVLLALLSEIVPFSIPDSILLANKLTRFAVKTRYIGDIEPVTEEDYNEALDITEKVYNWAREIIESGTNNNT